MSFPRYLKYEPSGVEWLGDVPEGWEVSRIKWLGKTVTGGTPKTEEPAYWLDGDVPWLPSGKVQNNTINKEDADTFITKRALAESAAKLIQPGAALIALTGATCANAAYLTFESTANQSVVGIEPQSNSSGRFIYFSLLSQREQVLTHKSGGAQGGINQEDVRNLVITAPPLAEQTAIAEFLDRETGKIDELVAEQRRLMELLKEKRQAVISHAVTQGLNPHAPMKPSGIEWLGDVPAHWTIQRVKSVINFITSGPRGWSDRISESGPIFVQSGDLNDALEVEFATAKRVQVEEDAETARTCLRDGDVVVCITGAKTGNVAVCSTVPETAYVNQHLCLVRPSAEILPHFLGMTLKSRGGQIYFALSQYGMKQGLSLEDVKDAPVVVPPISEQQEIVAFLDTELAKFDTLTAEAQRAIDLLQERRTALISAAVTGQIDVRNHSPKP